MTEAAASFCWSKSSAVVKTPWHLRLSASARTRNEQLLAADNFAGFKNASIFSECYALTVDKLCDLWYSAAFRFCTFLTKRVNCFMKKTVLPLKDTCQGEELYDSVHQIRKCLWTGCEKIVWIALDGASAVVAATRGLLHHLINSYPHVKSLPYLIMPQNILCLNWDTILDYAEDDKKNYT